MLMSSFLPAGNTLQGPSTVGRKWSGVGMSPFSDSLIISNIQLQERSIGRVLHAVTRKAAQNLLCLGSAQTQGCREFDHFVILLPDEFPFNRAREHRLQVW